ncbi:uncharacterized mitochondrial protein-like protein, partial [Tanacetum coccineum]
DIMLVQVYVDDIIFRSTNKSWCDEFEAFLQSRFQMSSMGELTFFLGLQVKQNKGGIFISQDKYVAEGKRSQVARPLLDDYKKGKKIHGCSLLLWWHVQGDLKSRGSSYRKTRKCRIFFVIAPFLAILSSTFS